MSPQAPPVVAVVTVCDAGPWLEQALATAKAHELEQDERIADLEAQNASLVKLTLHPDAEVRRGTLSNWSRSRADIARASAS